MPTTSESVKFNAKAAPKPKKKPVYVGSDDDDDESDASFAATTAERRAVAPSGASRRNAGAKKTYYVDSASDDEPAAADDGAEAANAEAPTFGAACRSATSSGLEHGSMSDADDDGTGASDPGGAPRDYCYCAGVVMGDAAAKAMPKKPDVVESDVVVESGGGGDDDFGTARQKAAAPNEAPPPKKTTSPKAPPPARSRAAPRRRAAAADDDDDDAEPVVAALRAPAPEAEEAAESSDEEAESQARRSPRLRGAPAPEAEEAAESSDEEAESQARRRSRRAGAGARGGGGDRAPPSGGFNVGELVLVSRDKSPGNNREGGSAMVMDVRDDGTSTSKARRGERRGPEEEDSQASTSRKREQPLRRTNVVVLFTGIDVDAKARAAVSAAGFALAARWGDATHLVSSVPLRRTPKLLTAVSVARHVVTLGWLWESDALGRAADERPFAVRDRENEAAWRFDLAASLAANGEGAGALADYAVLLDPRARRAGGPKLPKDGELKQIVECAGGVWLATPTKARVALGDRALLLLGDPATPLDASLVNIRAAPVRVGVEDFWTAVLSKRCPWEAPAAARPKHKMP
ncbi:hypothetical protein JL720_15768 [Aureococcus anophagefferens]|nr:hypothetical protein JL720_15768 [Aureococcus anophagefferens]